MTEIFESTIDNVSELEVKGYSDPVNMERTMEIWAKRGDEEYIYKFTGPGVEKFEAAADGRCWKENKKLKEAYDKLHAEKEDLKKENEDFGNQILEYIEMNNRLMREKDDLAVSAVAAKEKNKLLEIENEKLKKELQEIKEEFPMTANKILYGEGELKVENEDTDRVDKVLVDVDRFDSLIKENERVKNNLQSQHVMIVELNRNNHKLQEDNEKLNEKNKSLKDNYKMLGKEFDKVNKLLNYRSEQLEKLKKELSLEKDVNEAQHKNTRADILDQAKKCVCGHREQDYGTPESNFQLIADLWNGYLGFMDHPRDQIRATDVAMMMALMKIARIKNGGGSGDSFVDLAGYAACGGEIWDGERHTSN